MAHRIQFAEVRHVHAGRICQHGYRLGARHHHVSGRLVRPGRRTRLAPGDTANALVRVEDFHFHFLLCSLAFDASQAPLRSTDEFWLEVFAAALVGEHTRHEFRRSHLMIQILFFLFAALAAGAAINVLVQKHVLYSALSLILMLTAMSVLFVLLGADFLAVIQIIVYAGAIMVLFVFVIMLLNLPADEDGADRLRWLKFIGIPLGLFFLFLVTATLWNVETGTGTQPRFVGSPQAIGQTLFTDYLLPFEVTSLLILIALVGAVVFAKKDL